MQTISNSNKNNAGGFPATGTDTSGVNSDFNKPSNNGQSNLPSISIPKGGGAIRGIGEKFGANPVTGTVSASISIFTSPGRSGFGPSLSLSYDSGSGNGIFGFGWNLAIPSITRKTDKGLPKYEDATESDTFILSGAEDLVPLLVQVEDGKWKQQEPVHRTVNGIDYSIKLYRPRNEGLFARIERWTNTATGEIHWRSISKDNITTLYGKNEESRISDPYDPLLHTFSWLICESYDDKGNAIIYEYRKEDSTGVDLTAVHEKNRSEKSRSANRYLKKIKYGNKISRLLQPDLSSMSWMFEVVFDYGEHDLAKPTPQDSGEWLRRHDPFSSYRAGFEVRTYRLCQRVLMFHHFPKEEGIGNDCLVRSTDFEYRNIRDNDDDLKKGHPIASFISSVTQSGYRRLTNSVDDGSSSYLKKSFPPVEFKYNEAIIDEEIKEIDAESLQNLPYGVDGMHYQWVDLDGEGVSGILTEQGDTWFYKANLGGSKFGPIERVAFKPSLADLNSADQKLMDLAGDGQLDLVRLNGPTPGFYERNHDQRWESFTPFESLPHVDWNDPNLRFVDLTGDGHADILITENDVLRWYPSLAERGFESASSSAVTTTNLMLGSFQDEEERRPKLVFSDGTQSIYLADMSGDGLTDLVRIRNGEVCYWPNIGYGRFGPKVTMDNSSWFDAPDMFDQSRIILADIDGSGVTDIIYIGSDGRVHLYFNQSGNSWAEPRLLNNFPHIDNISSVTALDLLGNGTACLVWSSPLVGDTRRPLRYVDLMGSSKREGEVEEQGLMKGRGKPHLLISIKNNMGAETQIEYASSTIFYLADKAAGTPWVTKLPFPVHVVERVKTYDYISRNFFVTRYAYHHGYFDGIEREFRGFGMVEQYDTEEFETLIKSKAFPPLEEGKETAATTNIEAGSLVPPVLTKTWFHTGAYIEGDYISLHFAHEYYDAPKEDDDPNYEEKFKEFENTLLPDTILPESVRLTHERSIPWKLTAEEQQEACRALKGSILRHEIYSLDHSPKNEHPYTVSERDYTIELLQPQSGNNRHAVFFVHPSETIDYHYERNPNDPRISHTLALEVDDFGNVLKQASVAYGRTQSDPSPLLLPVDRDKQTKQLITYTENRVTNAIDIPDGYRIPLPCESQTYELTGYTPTGEVGRFQLEDFVKPPDPNNPNVLTHIFDREINYEDQPNTASGKQRRLIERVRTLYRKNDLTALLLLGELESQALQGETYKLAFTPGLLAQVFERTGQPLLSTNPTDPNSLVNVLGGTGSGQGGYIQSQQLKINGSFPSTDPDNYWWIPKGRVFYSGNSSYSASTELDFAARHFFLPHCFQNPFGKNTIFTYDSNETEPERNYNLLLKETIDPVGNRVTVGMRLPDGQIDSGEPGNDYRVLQSRLVTDPNRNRAEVAFDTLGMVTGTAVMGKTEEAVGDTLEGFEPDLTKDQLEEFYNASDPHMSAPNLLEGATTRIVYDLDRFHVSRETYPKDATKWLPVYSATLARETHLRLPAQNLKIQISFSYSDGFGREIQKKVQAEPGRVTRNGPIVTPRWVASGWTIFNNKGKPVRQYEPFFDDTHYFKFGIQVGVSPILFYDPMNRVIATLHPNYTYEKVVFNPWQQLSYDVNDTVAAHGTQTGDPRTDSDIQGYFAKYFGSLSEPQKWKTWFELRQSGTMGTEEQSAADKAAAHANTPTTIYFDTFGRPFLTIAHNRFKGDNSTTIVDEFYATRVELDIEGNQRKVRDAIVQNGDAQGRIVMLYDYDMLGNRIHQLSMEAGERWMLNDVTRKPIRLWKNPPRQEADPVQAFEMEYDELRRPIRSYVTGFDPTDFTRKILYQRILYGEQHPQAETCNIRGSKVYLQCDGAGVVASEQFDFKGNLVHSTRRLAKAYKESTDWNSVNAAIPLDSKTQFTTATLEAALSLLLDEDEETFTSKTKYDALNRPIQVIAPHSNQPGAKRNVIQPVYNGAGLLEQVHVWMDQEVEPDLLFDPAILLPSPVGVNNIDYNAKRQRLRIDYPNGVSTFYKYDLQTFHLIHLLTIRDAATFTDDCPATASQDWPGCQVQNLHYTYDPIGNIMHIKDDAQQTIFFNQKRVEPTAGYTYDAIYRLTEATGREHLGQVGGAPIPHSYNDVHRVGLFHPHDGRAMGIYTENYVYDVMGNLRDMKHRGDDPSNPGWTRHYDYKETSLVEDGTGGTLVKFNNRLSSTLVEGNNPPVEMYAYDNHGNMTQMPQLQLMQWNYKDQLFMTQRHKINDGDEEGIRRQGERTYYVYDAVGQRTRKITELPSGKLKDERIYLGQFEVCRQHSGANAGLLLETLHIMDDKQRIALVETRKDIDDGTLRQLIRYQFVNHIGSAVLELDEQARIISYEEYFPYGNTSFQAVPGQIEGKRYRYTGVERDEETGLSYHSARYYAPWLCRWTAADPIGIKAGLNTYVYVENDPTSYSDTNGTDREIGEGTVPSRPWRDIVNEALYGPSEYIPKLNINQKVLNERDQEFSGAKGQLFKKRIEEAATKVGLDPGLLAASVLAEFPREEFTKTSGEQATNIVGADYYVESLEDTPFAKRIPATAEIKFSRYSIYFNEQDKKKENPITIGHFDAKNAVLVTAIYLKHGELRVRDMFTARGVDFDSLTPELRFAFIRLYMNPGKGNPVGNQIDKFLLSRDVADTAPGVLIRTGVRIQHMGKPQSGATRVAAQAIHLSQKIFGNIYVSSTLSLLHPKKANP